MKENTTFILMRLMKRALSFPSAVDVTQACAIFVCPRALNPLAHPGQLEMRLAASHCPLSPALAYITSSEPCMCLSFVPLTVGPLLGYCHSLILKCVPNPTLAMAPRDEAVAQPEVLKVASISTSPPLPSLNSSCVASLQTTAQHQSPGAESSLSLTSVLYNYTQVLYPRWQHSSEHGFP
jgi:hypothetical protein